MQVQSALCTARQQVKLDRHAWARSSDCPSPLRQTWDSSASRPSANGATPSANRSIRTLSRLKACAGRHT